MRVTKRLIVASVVAGTLVLQPVIAVAMAPDAHALLRPLTEKLLPPLLGGNNPEREAAAANKTTTPPKSSNPNSNAHSQQLQPATSPTQPAQPSGQVAAAPVSDSQGATSQASNTLEGVDSAPLFFAPASIINPDSGMVLFSEEPELAVLTALGDGLAPHIQDDFSGSGSAILQSSEKGWQVFGIPWYWWVLAAMGIVMALRQLWIKRRVG